MKFIIAKKYNCALQLQQNMSNQNILQPVIVRNKNSLSINIFEFLSLEIEGNMQNKKAAEVKIFFYHGFDFAEKYHN